jgi:ribose 5-phosphate isomerase B
MRVFLGSDHGGFRLKSVLLEALASEGVETADLGAFSAVPSDYPLYAQAVAEAVRDERGSLGILLCRSGEGMEMAANKIPGIRAALVWEETVAAETRRDNDANVLVLPGDFVSDHAAIVCARRFIATPFSDEERHVRRIAAISHLEDMEYAT